MKRINLKLIVVVFFITTFVANFFTSDFPYPEYATSFMRVPILLLQ